MISSIIVAIIGAIICGVIGAVIGAYLQRKWNPDYSRELSGLRQEVQTLGGRFEEFRKERDRQVEIARFSPSVEIIGQLPEGQHIRFSANSPFTLREIEYVADTGAMVGREECSQSGQEVDVPIDRKKITNIHNSKPGRTDHPISIKFHCHFEIDGIEVSRDIDALVKPEYKMVNGALTLCLTVTRNL